MLNLACQLMKNIELDYCADISANINHLGSFPSLSTVETIAFTLTLLSLVSEMDSFIIDFGKGHCCK